MVKKKVTLEELKNVVVDTNKKVATLGKTVSVLDKKVSTDINKLTKTVQTLANVTNKLVGEFADFKYVTEVRFGNLEQIIDLLPTKDEYLTHEAKLMKELKDTRVEQIGTQGLYETVTKRVEIIDDKLGINSLTLAY